MKIFILLVVIGVVSAQLGAGQVGGAAPAQGAGGAAGVGGPGAAPVNPYGPKVYGSGLNNPFAFPHNTWEVSRAAAVAATNPNLYVRVESDGGWEFTNRFGEKVDVYNSFGQELD
ncbi:hypothetical protein OTU49_012144 [Cherax quadricarinatus]|uniref:Gastrolith protein 10 n=1 Tax=Cherax quadricarinatus TaxID=27406 RepID=D4N2K0_CHEQU|nr:uncharacterized protein LOC128700872 [Cherax quadricarinatus]ADD62496.1 gastrolith protein 10 [Cherax quadricarinatus]